MGTNPTGTLRQSLASLAAPGGRPRPASYTRRVSSEAATAGSEWRRWTPRESDLTFREPHDGAVFDDGAALAQALEWPPIPQSDSSTSFEA
jgi:hypothetical protein